MKAVQISKYGGSEVLEVVDDVPKPVVGKDQILVEVINASINPIDWKIRLGYLQERFALSFPVTMGGDFAGVVSEVGEGVSNFKVGDKVFGQGGIYNGGSGSFAEFVAAVVGKAALMPKNVDFVQGAALPLVGISALQAVLDHIKLEGGQKILILGGGGGIGHVAVQIAKLAGGYVSTTVSSQDMEFVRSLGADEVIDYKSEGFLGKLAAFDAVFNTTGKETTEDYFKLVKAGGMVVSMSDEPDAALAKKYKVSAIRQGTDSNPERLARLTKMVEEGKVKVNVDKVFPLELAKEAFEHLESGHPRGKVVLKIK